MYPLPVTSKANYKKWGGVLIRKGNFEGYSVLWAGFAVSKRVGLHNVHILKCGNVHVYATRRGDAFQALETKYKTKFFGKYTEIPENNRCIQSVHGCLVEVPFIPDDMWKALCTMPEPRNSRTLMEVDFDTPYPTWRNTSTRPSMKHQIAGSFGALFQEADQKSNFDIPDPFAEFLSVENLLSTEEGRIRYNIVAGFIYHYCRENLGYARVQ